MAYRCSKCRYRSVKWMGFCPQCRAADGLVEMSAVQAKARLAAPPTELLSAVDAGGDAGLPSGIGEVDRVLGAGLVEGSVVLLGGEPGVGKSTLLIQLAAGYGEAGAQVLLVSGEESAPQIARRARRLRLGHSAVELLATGEIDVALSAAEERGCDVLMVDSIQAMRTGEALSTPGGVAQVRECAARLVDFAKQSGTAVIVVGHVTKDGAVAGPKVLEHLVDAVLYFEGDAAGGFRLLRCVKNRFGTTHHVGIFEMTDGGLDEVEDPSAALVGGRRGTVPGTVIYAAVQGRRPVLVEIQALVVPSTSEAPRRSVHGLDAARVHQILAVLERHGGLAVGRRDLYIRAIGGLRVRDPGADLPVALAVASALTAVPLGSLAAFGEVGLTGYLRPVPQAARRRDEAARLGIETVISPEEGSDLGLAAALGVARMVRGGEAPPAGSLAADG